MNFHTFGDINNPSMVLIHGVLTPWQTLEEEAIHFSKRYYVVVPALDAHEEDKATEYISVSDEAKAIEDYIHRELDGRLSVLCGFSMGGLIAFLLWKSGIIGIDKLILDGAPLTGYPSIARAVMTRSYLNIISGSKKRDPKTIENFKKYFLPEKYLDSYLKIADNMSESSVRNMIGSVGKSSLSECSLPEADTDILFIHGTKSNEIISKSSAKKLKKLYPQTIVHCFKGYAHCEAAIFQPQEWISVVTSFLEK